MKFSIRKPEIYIECRKAFGVKWEDGVIFTYGDTVYCKYPLPPDLVVHEATHIEQQAKFEGGPRKWWDKYLIDKEFRLSQEVEAYRNQLQYLKNLKKDRNIYNKIFEMICRTLSSPMYGSMCTLSEAKELLMI